MDRGLIPRCDVVKADRNRHVCIDFPDHKGAHECACGHRWPDLTR